MGFQARRTMKAAQELYEGIEIEDMGLVGLITYMRTDSLRVSDEARQAAAEYIKQKYGDDYLPSSPREYKSKKNAQDAHEAIRPSMPELEPEKVKNSLTTDQYKIYKLIWERFIASQMANAQLDTVSAEINAGDYTFSASGYSVKFKGFTVVHVESKDTNEDETENKELPPLTEGDVLKVKALGGNQHFTQPPSRYTEATLIKTLEENGIGRPSTYAPTITTITARMYVERDGKQLKPTALGDVTTQLMQEHFSNIVDAKWRENRRGLCGSICPAGWRHHDDRKRCRRHPGRTTDPLGIRFLCGLSRLCHRGSGAGRRTRTAGGEKGGYHGRWRRRDHRVSL